jgi:hypothetical protein
MPLPRRRPPRAWQKGVPDGYEVLGQQGFEPRAGREPVAAAGTLRRVRHEGGGRSSGADLRLRREGALLMALVPRSGSVASRAGRMPRPVAQHIEAVRTGGLVTSAQVMAAAHVTKVALHLASALTAEEAVLVRISPLGEERYRLLVDSFTAVAAFRVSEMGL